MDIPKLDVVSDEFVVRLPGEGREASLEELAGIGSVELLPSRPDLAVLRLASKAKQAPKKIWQKVQDAAAKVGTVLPVFRDADAGLRYPAGAIVVRFKECPSDGLLDSLAESLKLEAPKRNKFAPTQASFDVKDPAGPYLPELLAKLQARDEVEAAWPETLSSYQRSI